MKKIKCILLTVLALTLTGCFKNESVENISITTSVYPIEYVVNMLYGDHSKITSMYPKDTDTNSFEVTNVLLDQYKDNDMFIFNGLSNESNNVKYLLKKNKKLKIIDVTANMQYDYSEEELWLDPNNLLTITNNIRKGFKEYITSTYLINEIEENYENLKIELTGLDGKYYSTAKNATNTTIIVSDDAFKYLEKYGIKVVSIDEDTAKEKTINEAKQLISNNVCSYIFIKYGEDSNYLNNFINETGITKLELYTMTNLEGIDIEKTNYIVLMNQNLENLKLELYK